jgi:hypothetical protein
MDYVAKLRRTTTVLQSHLTPRVDHDGPTTERSTIQCHHFFIIPIFLYLPRMMETEETGKEERKCKRGGNRVGVYDFRDKSSNNGDDTTTVATKNKRIQDARKSFETRNV